MMLKKTNEPSGPPPSWQQVKQPTNVSPLSTLNGAKAKEPIGPPPSLSFFTKIDQNATISVHTIQQQSKTGGNELLREFMLSFEAQTDQNSMNQTIINDKTIDYASFNINEQSSIEVLSSRKRRRDSESDEQEQQEMFTHNENKMMNDGNEIDDDEEEEDEEAFMYQPPQFASLIETDPKRLAQRQKQIDMGKNTIGYQNYTENVPRLLRQRFNKIHPVTPDIKELCSKRCFDGKIKAWRRQLHYWDILPGQSAANRVHVPNTTMRKRIRMDMVVVDDAERESNILTTSSFQKKTMQEEEGGERSMFVDDLEL